MKILSTLNIIVLIGEGGEDMKIIKIKQQQNKHPP